MIVVTTPTGNIGKQVLADLLDNGESVRVIVRDASRLPAGIAERVEVIEGSHGDLSVVNEAFKGADTVFWLVPPDMQATDVTAAYVDFTQPACEAFKSQGVEAGRRRFRARQGVVETRRVGFGVASHG